METAIVAVQVPFNEVEKDDQGTREVGMDVGTVTVASTSR